jgi:major membrane immunogen (membrane-anchored lipoprotein)
MNATRHRVPRFAVMGVLALVASLLVPAVTSSAEAALPTKHTTYKGDVESDDGIIADITIRVGASRTKIAKATATVQCDDGTTDKIVIENISVNAQGKFRESKGLKGQISGKFLTKHKVKGEAYGDLCEFLAGPYTAKD